MYCHTAVQLTNNNTKGGINCVKTVGQSILSNLATIIDSQLPLWTTQKN